MVFTIGQVATGENFWGRESEIEHIWDSIQSGSNVLLSAPRRIGKTSIMRKIGNEPKDGYIAIYIDTESADSQNEFWLKLYHEITKEDITSKMKIFTTKISVHMGNIKKISGNGIEFKDGNTTNLENAFKKIIENIKDDIKVIIQIDEFAQTVENIIKKEGKESALSFLRTHRELRMNTNISNKIVFMYAGSIGLESVVKKIDGTQHINDLKDIKIKSLKYKDAKQFIKKLASSNNLKIEDAQIKYLLDKIEWLIPFYIQLVLEEANMLHKKSQDVSNNTIDQAINNAIEHKNYFSHWQTRLKQALDNKSYSFAKEILEKICTDNSISSKAMLNIAKKCSLDEDEAKDIMASLDYDGYINNNDDSKIYRFNSPILKMWWCKNVAN